MLNFIHSRFNSQRKKFHKILHNKKTSPFKEFTNINIIPSDPPTFHPAGIFTRLN